MFAVVAYSRVTYLAKWGARISAIALTGLFAMFLFGDEAPPRLLHEPLRVQLIFACWAMIFSGYMVGWIKPGIGGLLVFVAIGLMNLVAYTASGRLLGPAFLLWLIPGILYLVAAHSTHSKGTKD